ncbi:MAG: hypothetical protein ACF8PN_07320 [Phycisphaerales bacterium]
MPMLLKGVDGTEFELALIDDEFPDLAEDAEADHSAVVSFRVAMPEESWEETAPVINLFEIQSLLDWLDAIAEGRPHEREVELLEPNLSFAVLDESEETVAIRIGFHLENRPEWAVIDAPTDEAGAVRLVLTRELVRDAVESLRADLRETTAS